MPISAVATENNIDQSKGTMNNVQWRFQKAEEKA